jgi:molecular chaperone GrpE
MAKKPSDKDIKIFDLVNDLQRVRADFENYRKRTENDLTRARAAGEESAIAKLLPIIDDIERAVGHIPAELTENAWAQGVAALAKNLEKTLANLGVTRINAAPSTPFNPELHHAVQFDETSDGEHEVIAEELQPGYMLGERVLREAAVRVKRQ